MRMYKLYTITAANLCKYIRVDKTHNIVMYDGISNPSHDIQCNNNIAPYMTATRLISPVYYFDNCHMICIFLFSLVLAGTYLIT